MYFSTKNLIIRSVKNTDTQEVFDTMNHKSIVEQVLFMKWPMTAKQANDWINSSSHSNYYDRLLASLHCGQILGCSCLWSRNHGSVAEIGYWIVPSKQRLGLGTEMVAASIKFFMEQFSPMTLYASTAYDNKSSQRLLEKCDFIFKGTSVLKNPYGKDRPSHLYERQVA